MANLEGGDFNKFIVIKREDVNKYLNASRIVGINLALDDIAEGRRFDNKKNSNTYLVINTDEPYADEIIEILKRNGHWGVNKGVTDMNFYEFNDFGYYALVGAKSEEVARKYYQETVADITEEEKDKEVNELTIEAARKKLLSYCKTEEQKEEAMKEFEECTKQDDPYLIGIDGSLI